MVWKRIIYALIIVAFAFGAGLAGALVGGLSVYRVTQLRQQTAQAVPTPETESTQQLEQTVSALLIIPHNLPRL